MKTKYRLSFVAIFTVMLIFSVFAATLANADNALPGSALYALDRQIEQIQRSFIKDPKFKAEFELEILNERLTEVMKLGYISRSAYVELNVQKEITQDAIDSLQDVQKEFASKSMLDQLQLELSVLESINIDYDNNLDSDINSRIQVLKLQIKTAEMELNDLSSGQI